MSNGIDAWKEDQYPGDHTRSTEVGETRIHATVRQNYMHTRSGVVPMRTLQLTITGEWSEGAAKAFADRIVSELIADKNGGA